MTVTAAALAARITPLLFEYRVSLEPIINGLPSDMRRELDLTKGVDAADAALGELVRRAALADKMAEELAELQAEHEHLAALHEEINPERPS